MRTLPRANFSKSGSSKVAKHLGRHLILSHLGNSCLSVFSLGVYKYAHAAFQYPLLSIYSRITEMLPFPKLPFKNKCHFPLVLRGKFSQIHTHTHTPSWLRAAPCTLNPNWPNHTEGRTNQGYKNYCFVIIFRYHSGKPSIQHKYQKAYLIN